MIPLVDMHCHLLPGLDDGPRGEADALRMCRLAYDEGVRISVALAHQNERWKANTPDVLRQAAQHLTQRLHQEGIALTVCPGAEVMVQPAFELSLSKGEYLSVADRGQYLLLEFPHGLFVDLRPLVECLRLRGLHPILAHPERTPELLHDTEQIEQLIRLGCLVQVSSGSVTAPQSRDRRALKKWFQRDIVHLLGSDGHSPTRRPPRMADAYHQIASWTTSATADRVCSTNGMAICHGLPLRISEPLPRPRRRFLNLRLW
ncbi:MAG: tyrosine-protein phosphatase [Gemmataceae bacterium]